MVASRVPEPQSAPRNTFIPLRFDTNRDRLVARPRIEFADDVAMMDGLLESFALVSEARIRNVGQVPFLVAVKFTEEPESRTVKRGALGVSVVGVSLLTPFGTLCGEPSENGGVNPAGFAPGDLVTEAV